MTVADWALVISLFSVGISLASFVWNVWSKCIYPKPKVRVGFSYVTIMHSDNSSDDYELLSLSATNHGPGEVTLTHAQIRLKALPFRKRRYGILNPCSGANRPFHAAPGPFAALPKKIGVGEELILYLVPNHEPLSLDNYDRIGFNDTFGQQHWASKKDIAEAKPHIRDALRRMGAALN
jgi:hypothetical protein